MRIRIDTALTAVAVALAASIALVGTVAVVVPAAYSFPSVNVPGNAFGNLLADLRERDMPDMADPRVCTIVFRGGRIVGQSGRTCSIATPAPKPPSRRATGRLIAPDERAVRLASASSCRRHFPANELAQANCYADLVAMAKVETGFDCSKDNIATRKEKSYGCWQWNLKVHKGVSVGQARDPYWAAEATLVRMMSFGYPERRSLGILRHNGSGPAAEAYLVKVKIARDRLNKMAMKAK